MKKKLYNSFFIRVLIITAMFVNTTAVFAAKPKESAKAAEADAQKKETVPEAGGVIKYTGLEAKRDPFAAPKVVVAMLVKADSADELDKSAIINLPKVDLQGIIWSKTMPQVIINGSVMKAGEFIEEFEIKEVTRNGMILFYKGKEYLMKMKAYESKKK